MRKLMLAGAAVAMALLLPLSMSAMASASPAATHDVLTWGKAGGVNVGKNQVLKANLASKAKAVFVSSGGTITCTKSSFTAKVTNNPKRPGTAEESVKPQTFTSCTAKGPDIMPGHPGASVKVNGLPYVTKISDGKGDPVTVLKSDTTVMVDSILGEVTCVYKAKASTTKGTASNKSQTITFTNQVFTKTSGPSVCSGTGKFSATYGPVIDTSVKHDPHVFVN
jgi:hypothetical protein